jgi:hypothetical protein
MPHRIHQRRRWHHLCDRPADLRWVRRPSRFTQMRQRLPSGLHRQSIVSDWEENSTSITLSSKWSRRGRA